LLDKRERIALQDRKAEAQPIQSQRGSQLHTMSHQPTFALAEAPASHPHLLITLPATKPAHRDTFDRYHVSFNLPDSIFVDRHELIDLWGQGGRVEWELTPEKIDIERPISNTTEYSTLRVGWSDGGLDIPLHVRYLEPNDKGSEVVNLFREDGVAAGWNCVGMKGRVKHLSATLTIRHLMPLYCSAHITEYHPTHWTRIRPLTCRTRYAGIHLVRVDLPSHENLVSQQTERTHQDGLIASAYHSMVFKSIRFYSLSSRYSHNISRLASEDPRPCLGITAVRWHTPVPQ
jgi:hypothetical protein